MDLEGSIFVTGQTFVNMNSNEGITTSGNNAGFSLVTKDNIIVEEYRESHTSAAAPTVFTAFFYTEESIYIEAVNSRVHLQGSLFARGLGVSGNQIFYDNESAAQINGIVINSLQGYVNGAGVFVDSALDSANRFNMDLIANSAYEDRFSSIPIFETVITIPGLYAFVTSEFILE